METHNPISRDVHISDYNSSESHFVPINVPRQLIRPRKPPLIPLHREDDKFYPFRYSTNNNFPQSTTTTSTTETPGSSSDETIETKNYIGMPGYWKPIRVPPYGYNYPRW